MADPVDRNAMPLDEAVVEILGAGAVTGSGTVKAKRALKKPSLQRGRARVNLLPKKPPSGIKTAAKIAGKVGGRALGGTFAAMSAYEAGKATRGFMEGKGPVSTKLAKAAEDVLFLPKGVTGRDLTPEEESSVDRQSRDFPAHWTDAQERTYWELEKGNRLGGSVFDRAQKNYAIYGED